MNALTRLTTHSYNTDQLLHVACACDHQRIVEYLLTDCHLNSNAKNDQQQTPLSLAKSKEVMKLLLQHGAHADNVYTEHRKTLGNIFSKNPLKSPVKMFVIGHGGEGKSTLIEAMKHEPTIWTSLVNIFVSPKEVEGVDKRTAGIIPQVFDSRLYGNVLFYDFAGQEAYYSSHAAVIKSSVDSCPPVFLLVVGLHRGHTAIAQSVSYWLGIITNQCGNMESKAPLIVVGSHADLIQEKSEVETIKNVISSGVKKYTLFDLVDIVCIDCRYSNSSSMKVLRHHVETSCSSLRTKLSVSLNSHMFLYLVDNFTNQFAVTLQECKDQLDTNIQDPFIDKKTRSNLSFIPATILD